MFTTITIRTKLLLLMLLGSIALIWVAAYGLVQLQNLTTRGEKDTQILLANQELLMQSEQTLIQFKTQVQEWKNILIRGNKPAEYEKYLKQFGESEAKTATALGALEKGLKARGGEAALATKALSEHQILGEKYREALKGFNAAELETGKQVDASVKGMDRPLAAALETLGTHILLLTKSEAATQLGESKHVAERTGAWMLGISLLALACLIGGGLWLAHTIVSSLDVQRRYALRIEQERDLSLRIPERGRDELSQCAQAINAMLIQFQIIVREIREKSILVNQQTQTIVSAVSEITHAAEEQENASSAASAATEELSVSIAHVGESAAETQQLAARSLELTAHGQRNIEEGNLLLNAITERISKTTRIIEELAQRSDAISNIVQTVKEIANQTNLLALNAAIEAARAGEQGRGFAIVADEVRKLAESTTKSAAEIDSIAGSIQTSATDAIADVREVVRQFDGQLTKAQETHTLIEAIQNAAHQTNEASTRISESLREQTAGGHLMAEQIEHIAAMTNKSARELSEVNHSAQTLDTLVGNLAQTASRFQV